MADYEPLPVKAVDEEFHQSKPRTRRVASLDVFRGVSVSIMIIVDYAGAIFPILAHCPWNGVHLADFVMPFFLFVVGVSLALVYKNVTNRVDATWKAFVRAIKLFLLGVFLQGGYFHSSSLTFGVDIEKLRWLGVLQRISIGYLIAALSEIWLPNPRTKRKCSSWGYFWHWCVAFYLSAIYLGLLHGLYVPDWHFRGQDESLLLLSNSTYVYKVKCSVRGDYGPACNAAGMIDRSVLGIYHLHKKPTYRNLKECSITRGLLSENAPSWCLAPFEPEGILSSLMASVACIIGLQYGNILTQTTDHKKRLCKWSLLSILLLALGLLLSLLGIPLNKSLYTASYTALTSGTAGITFCALYVLVDVFKHRKPMYLFEWMGTHSLSIFILVTSNVVVLLLRGFYWASPQNNIVDWVVSHVVER